MEIVLTPSSRWLETAIQECRTTLRIASPFVGNALIELLKKSPKGVATTLITRTRLVDFASGASDIRAVISAAQGRALVLGLDRLHAKVYVFDETVALVTSANATYSGFRKNAECGIAFRDVKMAQELALQVCSGFGASPPPGIWTETQLRSLVPAVEQLKQRVPQRTVLRVTAGDEPDELELTLEEADALLTSTAAWTQLVFRNAIRLPHREFTTQQVFDACKREISQRFPSNQHPREKVRQQLQVLRDLGLIQFLDKGRYRIAVTLKT